MVGFIHIISFKFPEDATAETIADFKDSFLALETGCLKDGKPYINIKGGKQLLDIPPAHGMQLTFIVEFESKADSDLFHTDPFHAAFIPKAKSVPNGAVIQDFIPGSY